MFDYSSAFTYGLDGVLTTTDRSHALSKTAYTLPLYIEIVMYIDGFEEYRFERGVTAALFPDWAVSDGSVRLGVYASSSGEQFRNFKVASYNPWV
jgi:hypothetical protein